MLAIHGIWAHCSLILWAEDASPAAASQAGKSEVGKTRSGKTRPGPHPFAAAGGLLADVLAEFGEPVSDLVRKATDDELTLWLPTVADTPLGSPDLDRLAGRPGQGSGRAGRRGLALVARH